MSQVFSSSRCSVNVWGTVTRNCLGPLIRLPRLFNPPTSCQVIENELIPKCRERALQRGVLHLTTRSKPLPHFQSCLAVTGRARCPAVRVASEWGRLAPHREHFWGNEINFLPHHDDRRLFVAGCKGGMGSQGMVRYAS